MVLADFDVLTRSDMNDLAASIPDGVKFTTIADASGSHTLMPHPCANGADKKVRTRVLSNRCFFFLVSRS